MKVDEIHSRSLIISLPDHSNDVLANGALIKMIVVFCGPYRYNVPTPTDLSQNHKRRDRWNVIAEIGRERGVFRESIIIGKGKIETQKEKKE